MAETRWRVLQIDAHGDIEELNSFATKPEAVRCLARQPLPDGCVLTVEGWRDYESLDLFGDRRFRRTGITRTGLNAPANIVAIWRREDGQWYTSGDEPDFADRG